MLKVIRNNSGWVLVLTGLLFVVSSIKRVKSKTSITLLCFDQGCVYVQGVTSLALGILIIIVGGFLVVNQRRVNRNK